MPEKTKEELKSDLQCGRHEIPKCRTFKKGKNKGKTICYCSKEPFPSNFMRIRIFDPDPNLWFAFRKGRTRSYVNEKTGRKRSSNYYITSMGQQFYLEDETTASFLPETQLFLTLDIGSRGGIMFIRGVPRSFVSDDIYQQVANLERQLLDLKKTRSDKKKIYDLQARIDEISFVKWERTRTQAIRAEYGKSSGKGIGAPASLIREYEEVWYAMEDEADKTKYDTLKRRMDEIQSTLIEKFMKKYGEIAKTFLSREWDTPISSFKVVPKERDFQLLLECEKGCTIY